MASNHLSKLQVLFQIGEHHPIALRALQPGLPPKNFTFSAADHPAIEERWEAFAKQAVSLNNAGYNIFTCMNPIRPDFSGNAVCDADIECRRLLLVDLDRTGVKSAPATEEEIRQALVVADKIKAWLLEETGKAPTRVLSGNGIHLYYGLTDLPNDRQSHHACEAVLRVLAERFNTGEIEVDQTVKNASRITKVPGTFAYKGQASDDRPYRMAKFL